MTTTLTVSAFHKGAVFAPEASTLLDERTGNAVTQWTCHPSIHHHPFFYVPAYSSDGKEIIFVSHRSGSPQLYSVRKESGEITQLTEREEIGEWSLHPSWQSNFVLYIAGQTGYRLDLSTLEEEAIADFSHATGMNEKGMVGAAMGVTALSWCDRYWAVRVNTANGAALTVTDLHQGHSQVILERDEIGHLSFCPDESTLLFAARTLQDRVWLINRDGSGHRRLHQRKAGTPQNPGEWITHEFWMPGRNELAFINWPHGIRAVHVETGQVRAVSTFNAWHAVTSRDGRFLVADTNFPDIGLQLLDLASGTQRVLCYPGASNAGRHWGAPFPYEAGPIPVYAPQHTHPHPSFSPDGRHVVFTSDREGHSQIYEVAH
jgi:oligogalacturonide lyase